MAHFDAIQAAAVLVTCEACGRSWYMTVVHVRCFACRDQQPVLKREPKVDVSGQAIDGP
jgi:hypothetical protein